MFLRVGVRDIAIVKSSLSQSRYHCSELFLFCLIVPLLQANLDMRLLEAECSVAWDVAQGLATRAGDCSVDQTLDSMCVTDQDAANCKCLAPLGKEIGKQLWIEPMLEVFQTDLHGNLLQLRDARQASFVTLSYGSDCSGIDAPALALSCLFKALNMHPSQAPLLPMTSLLHYLLTYLLLPTPYSGLHNSQFNWPQDSTHDLQVQLSREFCSEAPGADSQKLLLLWNHNPRIIFDSCPCCDLSLMWSRAMGQGHGPWAAWTMDSWIQDSCTLVVCMSLCVIARHWTQGQSTSACGGLRTWELRH